MMRLFPSLQAVTINDQTVTTCPVIERETRRDAAGAGGAQKLETTKTQSLRKPQEEKVRTMLFSALAALAALCPAGLHWLQIAPDPAGLRTQQLCAQLCNSGPFSHALFFGLLLRSPWRCASLSMW